MATMVRDLNRNYLADHIVTAVSPTITVGSLHAKRSPFTSATL